MGNIGSRQTRFDVLPTSPLPERVEPLVDVAAVPDPEPRTDHERTDHERTVARVEPARS